MLSHLSPAPGGEAVGVGVGGVARGGEIVGDARDIAVGVAVILQMFVRRRSQASALSGSDFGNTAAYRGVLLECQYGLAVLSVIPPIVSDRRGCRLENVDLAHRATATQPERPSGEA